MESKICRYSVMAMSKTDYLKPSDYGRVYMLMQYENALAMRVSLETGLRIGDVLNLKPENITEKHIEAVAQKTGKDFKKPISADLKKRLLQISGKKWIFEGRVGDEPRSRATVWKDVKQASKKLGLDINLGCHSARKTYAVELFKSQGIKAVQKELQHDNTETSMLYAFAHLLKAIPNEEKTESHLLDSDAEEFLAELIADKVINKLRVGLPATQAEICEAKSRQISDVCTLETLDNNER